jgi:hypothetical protein
MREDAGGLKRGIGARRMKTRLSGVQARAVHNSSQQLTTAHNSPQQPITARVIPARLGSSRPLSLLDPLRSPVEQRGGVDEIAPRLQGDPALGLGIFERVDAGEMAVDEAPIGQWPRDRRMFGWLQFRGIRAGATASVRVRARAGGRWCASLPSRRGRARRRSAWWDWRRRHGQTRPAPPRTAGWQTLMARWQMMRPGSLRAGWTTPTR